MARLTLIFLLIGHWVACLNFMFERLLGFPDCTCSSHFFSSLVHRSVLLLIILSTLLLQGSWSHEYGIEHMKPIHQYMVIFKRSMAMLILIGDNWIYCEDITNGHCLAQAYTNMFGSLFPPATRNYHLSTHPQLIPTFLVIRFHPQPATSTFNKAQLMSTNVLSDSNI